MYWVNIVPPNGEVAGSSITECILVLAYTRVGTFSCVQIDERKAREREILIASSMKADEHKNLKSGNAEPYARATKMKARGTGGGGEGKIPATMHGLLVQKKGR